RELSRRGKSRRVVAKVSRYQFITNLPVELLVERFASSPIEPNHFECHNRTAAAPLAERFVH
ncbi:MAG TPA: hypothetical protein VEQ38_06915, partial [Verrucomicrobiae bacterium]|nr:hypothetical protein [Verrucomicrobiae bacterium]